VIAKIMPLQGKTAVQTMFIVFGLSLQAPAQTEVISETAAPLLASSGAYDVKHNRLSSHIQKTYRVSKRKADQIVTEAFRSAKQHGVDTELILAVIAVESTFRERAVSHKGARGLMQIIPRYHPKKVRAIGGVRALFDPRKNIDTGSKILVQYLKLSRGNLRRALLRYNGSLGNPRSPYADKVLRVYRTLRKVTREGTSNAFRDLGHNRLA